MREFKDEMNALYVNESLVRREEGLGTFKQITIHEDTRRKLFLRETSCVFVDHLNFENALGLIVLGFGEDVMDILNTSDFTPKEF